MTAAAAATTTMVGQMPNPIYRGAASFKDSRSAIADRKRDESGRRDWSTRKHICVAIGFIIALWVLCFLSTTVMVEALLRVTS